MYSNFSIEGFRLCICEIPHCIAGNLRCNRYNQTPYRDQISFYVETFGNKRSRIESRYLVSLFYLVSLLKNKCKYLGHHAGHNNSKMQKKNCKHGN